MKKSKPIYVITAMRLEGRLYTKKEYNIFSNKVKHRSYSDERTWGYYYKRSDAIKEVMKPNGIIWIDPRFNVAVIEEMCEGMLPYESSFKRLWFKKSRGIVKHVMEPSRFKHIVNFSMG